MNTKQNRGRQLRPRLGRPTPDGPASPGLYARGSAAPARLVPIAYTLASRGAERLWQLLQTTITWRR